MKHGISDSLRLPSDLTRGDILVSVTGRHEVFVENYKGIIEYTDCRIMLSGKSGSVLLEGKELSVVYYTGDEMKVEGTLDNICFLE